MIPLRAAAIDIGSNTVHLLVAEFRHGEWVEVYNASKPSGLGFAVTVDGRIGAAHIGEIASVLRRFAKKAENLGASELLLGATEAVRRAADSGEALAQFSAAAGVTCHLLSRQTEAELTFLGATHTRANKGRYLVIDVGGASTEIAAGTKQDIDAPFLLPVGSASATTLWLPHDPPTDAELAHCAAEIQRRFSAAPRLKGIPIATGGTVKHLFRLSGNSNSELSIADLLRCRELLRQPSGRLCKLYKFTPQRARTLAAGVEILIAAMNAMGIDHLAVSQQGVRTGMLLARQLRGNDWAGGLRPGPGHSL